MKTLCDQYMAQRKKPKLGIGADGDPSIRKDMALLERRFSIKPDRI
ncbi:hypothetical protein HY990_03720 [Candidatus Micrarchaeota archaeon]|nr:hypothetical protein [Candidatus Micrarchaeota archaeon]